MHDINFIHLNCHSEYSLIDSTIRIKSLLDSCKSHNMPAVAITDHQNLFAVVKFYKAAMSAGIKPLIGADIVMHNPEDEAQSFKSTLLCKSTLGYQNLTKIVSRAYLEGQGSGTALIDRAWFSGLTDGLIMLSGAQFGDVGQAICAGKMAKAEKLAKRWSELFPDRYYLEIQRVGRENEEHFIKNALQIADKHELPVVATNAVRFLVEDDFTSHEARVAIHSGYTLTDSRRPKHYTRKQYLRSAKEMLELFADIPEALENTVEIAKRCTVDIDLNNTYLPNFPIPQGMNIEEYLAKMSEDGLDERLDVIFAKDSPDFKQHYQQYHKRLKIELDVINQMGFPGYFLIVADFIRWAKENDVPVGPGRGSGAGSLVAYALKITDLDPIEHGLLFERFLNPERVSMPDFDIDFCMDGRDRVIDYVSEKLWP